jgi:long-subunit fatty acid transport protein
MKHASPLLLLAACLLASSAGQASASNGAQPAFYGAKGPISMPTFGDGQTAYRMPSGVAWSLDHKIDFDAFFLYTSTTLKNSLNDFDSSGFSPAASFGIVLSPGERESETAEGDFVHPQYGTFAFHFGVYPELGGGGGRNRMRWTTYPDGIGVGTSPLFISTAFSAAYAPTDWVSLGVGFQLIPATLKIRTLVGGTDSSLNGSPQIAGVPIPGNPTYADFLGLFQSDAASDPTTFFQGDLSTIQFGALFSLSLRPTDFLAFGFSYRPRSWAPMPFEGDGELRAEASLNGAIANLDPAIQQLFLATLPEGGNNGFSSDYDVEITGIKVPRQVRANLVAYPTDWLLLGFEAAWIEWHRSFRRAVVILDGGQNTDLNFVTSGDEVGTIETLRWHNQWVFSFYAAIGIPPVDGLTVRLGFQYSESPVDPENAGNGPSAAFVGSTVTFGAGYWLTEGVELSFLTELALPDGANSGPFTSSLTTNNTRYSAFQAAFHFGLSVRF